MLIIDPASQLASISNDLFNIIINGLNRLLNLSSYYPSSWSESIVKPIFKSGSTSDPNNYRGISLLNVLGKIFNSLLRNKLEDWANEHKILTPSQFGIRPGFRTTDTAFVLHSAIQKQLLKKEGIVCMFCRLQESIRYHSASQAVAETARDRGES